VINVAAKSTLINLVAAITLYAGAAHGQDIRVLPVRGNIYVLVGGGANVVGFGWHGRRSSCRYRVLIDEQQTHCEGPGTPGDGVPNGSEIVRGSRPGLSVVEQFRIPGHDSGPGGGQTERLEATYAP
jgi:hypothetical protein